MSDKNHIIHLVSNNVWGGGEQYVYDICNHLSKDEFDVTLFVKNESIVASNMSNLKCPIHKLSLRGVTDIVSAYKLARFLNRTGRCVIHVHNFKDAFTAVYAKILSTNNNVRIVVTRHLVRKGKSGLIYRWLYRKIDKIFFVSELARKEFVAGNPSILEKLHTAVIPNSIVVPPLIKPVDIRTEFNIPENCTLAIYHGRIAEEKGLDILLEAIKMVNNNNIRIVIIGTGEDTYVTSLKQKAYNLGIEHMVNFIGFRKPVLPYICNCDFGILPSTVRESSLLSCMEYMSQGRCVITTNNGGQSEYLTNGVNALLVEPGNVVQLAECIRQLTDNPELRIRLSNEALKNYKENLNYNIFIKRIIDIYEN